MHGRRSGGRRYDGAGWLIRAVAAALAVAMIASACDGDRGRDDRRRDRRRGDRGATSEPTVGTPPPAVGDLRLGRLTVTAGSARCPPGENCKVRFQVACPGLRAPASGTLNIFAPAGSPRGVVMTFSGGRGSGLLRTPIRQQFERQMQAAGVMVVEVPWEDSWLEAAPGEQAGPSRLGCRPATAVKWVHDQLFRPLSVPDGGLGTCGFCLAGDSGGASQVAYPLTHYGLADLVDVAVLASGPVHTALDEGCLRQGDRGLWYSDRFSAPIIDSSYGFLDGDGPCVRRDRSFAEVWDRDSMETSGSAYSFPRTRVVFVFGSRDESAGPPHGEVLLQRLREAGSPHVDVRSVVGMGHLTANSPEGTAVVRQELLAA